MTRRILAVLLFLLLTRGASAQTERPQVHPLLKPMIDRPETGIPKALRGPLGLGQGERRIQGQETLNLFLRTTATREQLEALGIKVRTLRGNRATVTVPVQKLSALAARPDVQLITLPTPFRPTLNQSVSESGASSIRSQAAGVFSGDTGAGVVVGVVDSGIDFDHPDFTDASGNTRIAWLWDQTSAAGPAPSAYAYGREWTAADIDGGLCTEVDDSSAWGHGTHVTGIAAGSGAAPDASGSTYTHTGMAPNATIIFVKTDWSSTGLIDAVNYIFEQADVLGLPAVVNLSLGSQIGAHDGTDPLEEEIDALVTAKAGRAVVVAAGNEGGDGVHAEIQAVNAVSVTGPDFEIPTYTRKLGSDNDFVYVVGYYPSTDELTVHLWSPSGNYYNQSLTATGCLFDQTGSDGAVYLCNNETSSFGQGTPDREIAILIYDDSSATPPADGTWSMALTGNTVAGSGWVDFWTYSSLGSNGDIASFTTHVDEEETLGIPATAREALAVGAYVTDACWDSIDGSSYSYSPMPSLGDIASFSSRGPTRDGRAKPELAAPGMGIVSSLAQEVKAAVSDEWETDTWHQLMQGTSQAAPHVAGAIALFFEDDPTLDAGDVESLLRDHARDDDWTQTYDVTFLTTTKNHAFGSGKLNVGSWSFADPYETNDSHRTAREVLSGQNIAGYLDHAADLDTFELEAITVNDTVKIDLTGLADNYKLNLLRSVPLGGCFSPAFSVTASSDNAGTADETITHTTTLFSLARFFRVLSSAGGFSATTPYSLKAVITRPETTAVHNSTATAQSLPAHNEFKISGSIAVVGQQDFYKLTAGRGQTITARAGLTRTVQILNSSGTVLATSFGGTANYTVPAFALGTGTYHVVVSGGAAGSYTLTTTVN